MLTLFLAFTAGLLTILSPCVLPLAPIVIAGARAQDMRGPLALAAGLAVSFGIVGGLLASFSIEFGDSGLVRNFAAGLMIVFGLIMLVPILGLKSEYFLGPLAGFADRLAETLPKIGLLGQFFAGIVLAFAWAPCVGPTLGAAFALAASGGSLPAAIAIMAVFALGSAAALLIAGYALGKMASGSKMLARQGAKYGSIALAIVLILVGVAIVSGFDKVIETAFLDMMPIWLVSFATRV